ncbi:tRNA uridine-5-carboxymethylaminomethyl(34) synthesis GTPase MnmE [bacterium]|nr:tRNA uridine-5-carboxymethylaminomethyl(34) synthesis GTPase MnmE [bacterium]
MVDGQDTIAAISSPPGRGGIGIIRISGPDALTIASRIVFSKKDILQMASSHTRRFFHAVLKNLNKEKIDEVLVAYLPKSKSYTGECTVELNCHGGKAIMAYALETVIQAGARMAEPGEFTRRAMESGRINLIQAEAVNEIIHARTKKAVHASWQQMDGALTDKCNDLKLKITGIISEMQAVIDFEVDSKGKDWENRITQVINIIMEMLSSAEKGRYLTHGCWVVLTGPPNAGKSSLFNSILNIERALVTNIPGTTRDHISEVIEIEGIEVRLSDTAGIRDVEDVIEKIAVERSKTQLKAADIVVYVLDQNTILDSVQEEMASQILNTGGFVLLNKCDLERHPTVDGFYLQNKGKNVIPVSMISKQGLDEFLNRMAEVINDKAFGQGNPIITSLRQSKLLKSAGISLEHARLSILKDKAYDISMFEIHSALKSLAEIIGEVSDEDILNSIFSKFCIGK